MTSGEASVGKRRLGREMALQMLFQTDLGGARLPQVLLHFDPLSIADALRDDEGESGRRIDRAQLDAGLEYARRLVTGTIERREELDSVISEQAENWRLERMSAVDRNVLRLGAYELLFEPDVPKLVVLDEAIELAKRYGAEDSGRFVNGILDGIFRSHELPGRAR